MRHYMRHKRQYVIFLVVIFLIQFALGCHKTPVKHPKKTKKAETSAEAGDEKVLTLASENTITDEYALRFYSLATSSVEAGYDAFEIVHKEKKVYYEADRRYSIKTVENTDYVPKSGEPIETKDITGDGIPELIIGVWSGGAHCCFSIIIFSLGEEFKKIAEIEGGDSSFEFRDFEGDGIYELVGRDWIFAYWETSFAQSPAPQIVLRYLHGRYVLATDLMKKQPPEKKEIQAKIDEMNNAFAKSAAFDDETPPELWQYMLDLIYSGNGKIALTFFDKAWPDHREGKEEFLAAFKAQLAKSSYWPEIKAFNKWK
jgi:hypothetical protein